MSDLNIGSVVYEIYSGERGEVVGISIIDGKTTVYVFIGSYDCCDKYLLEDFLEAFTNTEVKELEPPESNNIWFRKSNKDIYYVVGFVYNVGDKLIVTRGTNGEEFKYTPKYFYENFEQVGD